MTFLENLGVNNGTRTGYSTSTAVRGHSTRTTNYLRTCVITRTRTEYCTCTVRVPVLYVYCTSTQVRYVLSTQYRYVQVGTIRIITRTSTYRYCTGINYYMYVSGQQSTSTVRVQQSSTTASQQSSSRITSGLPQEQQLSSTNCQGFFIQTLKNRMNFG